MLALMSVFRLMLLRTGRTIGLRSYPWRGNMRMTLKGTFPPFVLCALLIIVCVAESPTLAEPMDPPSIEEACASKTVVEAQYLSRLRRWNPFSPFTFHDGPIAVYRVLRVHRGEVPTEEIRVKFEFHDGSPCQAPEDWEFSDSLMPAKDSRWLLFLEKRADGIYRTYRGDYGRMTGNSETDEIVKKCVQEWQKQEVTWGDVGE